MKSIAVRTNRNLLITLVVAAVLALGVFATGWYFILKLSNESNRYDTEANGFLEQNSALSDLKLSLAKIFGQKEAVLSTIPRTKDISLFLADFENLARNDGITIASTNVGDIKTKAKAGSDFSQTVNKNEYFELPIAYDVRGNYSNLTKLLSDIDVQKRLASVTDLIVIADTADKTTLGNVRATFVVTVYVRK